MKRIENECCDCATPGYPCMKDRCPNRHVLHYYCDKCGCDIDLDEGVFADDEKDLCLECLMKVHRKNI